MPKITPFLWFNNNAEDAVRFYVSVFKHSKITNILYYPKAGHEIHGRKPNSVMTVSFTLAGKQFTALNGGPIFKFNESISFVVHCHTQREIDNYWKKLGAGGPVKAQQCGWLKDKFGVSWQIVPARFLKMLGDRNQEKVERAMGAMMQMKKLDIAKLKAAFAGTTDKKR